MYESSKAQDAGSVRCPDLGGICFLEVLSFMVVSICSLVLVRFSDVGRFWEGSLW